MIHCQLLDIHKNRKVPHPQSHITFRPCNKSERKLVWTEPGGQVATGCEPSAGNWGHSAILNASRSDRRHHFYRQPGCIKRGEPSRFLDTPNSRGLGFLQGRPPSFEGKAAVPPLKNSSVCCLNRLCVVSRPDPPRCLRPALSPSCKRGRLRPRPRWRDQGI